SPERVHLQGGALLPPRQVVPGCHRTLQGSDRDRLAVHVSRRRVLPPGRGTRRRRTRSRSAAVPRTTGGGVPGKRTHGGRRRADLEGQGDARRATGAAAATDDVVV